MRHLWITFMLAIALTGAMYAQPGQMGGMHGGGGTHGHMGMMQNGRGMRGTQGSMGMFGQGMYGMPGIRMMLKKMDLNEQQKDELKNIQLYTQKQMIDIRADMQKAGLEMRNIMQSDAPDRAAFEQAARNMSDLQMKQKMLLFDTRAKVVQQLTPEQQKQLHSMMENAQSGRRGRMMNNDRDNDEE